MAQSVAKVEENVQVVDGLAIRARVLVPQKAINSIPIVLVHGLGVSGRYMLPVGQVLAEHHRVLIPDLPGFGRSDKPPQVLSVSRLAEVLSAWLKATGIPRADFLGNSIGCQVIVDL